MITRAMCLLSLLACACGAVAAPLPTFWPLDVATRELGWRFKKEFASWPGQPAGAPSPDSPATWGLLRLGDRLACAPEPQTAGRDISAPFVDERPVLDGRLGWEEWAAAAQAIELLGEGGHWLLLARHNGTTLYVCLAAPSVLAARRGQVAELYLAPVGTAGTSLSAEARLFHLRVGRERQPVLKSFHGERGEWREIANPLDDPLSWRGDVGSGGDGAWAYAVYEFAIPLPSLGGAGCQPAAGGEAARPTVPPVQWRCMARLQTHGHGDPVGGVRNQDPESVLWPDNRTSYAAASPTPVVLRPDYWQRLVLGAQEPQEGLSVPVVARPLRIDGRLGPEEWHDAHVAEYVLPGGQWRRMMLARDADRLYLAVRLHVARGLRQQESCRVYVDPCGDGGLLPRGDDRQYRVSLGSEGASETLAYGPEGWRVVATNEIAAAGYSVNAYESCYELALPLTALGPTRSPGLAVEVSYGLPQ